MKHHHLVTGNLTVMSLFDTKVAYLFLSLSLWKFHFLLKTAVNNYAITGIGFIIVIILFSAY